MWLSERVIPALIDAVNITLRETLEAYEADDFDPDGHYDPNDLMIFDGFVLPVLVESRNKGCESSDMLDKGFAFLMGLLPWYLKSYGDQMTDDTFGELALLFYRYQLHDTLNFLEVLEPAYLKENIDRIDRRIARSQLKLE